MATLEQEVQDLKTRLTRLEAVLSRLVRAAPQVGGPGERAPQDQTALRAWLKTQGLVRDPTDEERREAAVWDALSEEEQEAHRAFMHRLVLEPPFSQILIEQRR
jgi:hypothetical protein